MKRFLASFILAASVASPALTAQESDPYKLVIVNGGVDERINYISLMSCTLVLRHALGHPDRKDWEPNKLYKHKSDTSYRAGCFLGSD